LVALGLVSEPGEPVLVVDVVLVLVLVLVLAGRRCCRFGGLARPPSTAKPRSLPFSQARHSWSS